MAIAQAMAQLIVPATIAGIFGCASAFLTSRLMAANERKKFERELAAKFAERERDFAMQYAQLVGNNPRQAEAVRQQFASAYLHLADRSERYFIPRSTRVIIGRGASAEIIIDDPMLSRTHASIESVSDIFWLTDLRSGNGTILNGNPVVERVRLSDGDELTFGEVRATFRLLADREWS